MGVESHWLPRQLAMGAGAIFFLHGLLIFASPEISHFYERFTFHRYGSLLLALVEMGAGVACWFSRSRPYGELILFTVSTLASVAHFIYEEWLQLLFMSLFAGVVLWDYLDRWFRNRRRRKRRVRVRRTSRFRESLPEDNPDGGTAPGDKDSSRRDPPPSPDPAGKRE